MILVEPGAQRAQIAAPNGRHAAPNDRVHRIEQALETRPVRLPSFPHAPHRETRPPATDMARDHDLDGAPQRHRAEKRRLCLPCVRTR